MAQAQRKTQDEAQPWCGRSQRSVTPLTTATQMTPIHPQSAGPPAPHPKNSPRPLEFHRSALSGQSHGKKSSGRAELSADTQKQNPAQKRPSLSPGHAQNVLHGERDPSEVLLAPASNHHPRTEHTSSCLLSVAEHGARWAERRESQPGARPTHSQWGICHHSPHPALSQPRHMDTPCPWRRWAQPTTLVRRSPVPAALGTRAGAACPSVGFPRLPECHLHTCSGAPAVTSACSRFLAPDSEKGRSVPVGSPGSPQLV